MPNVVRLSDPDLAEASTCSTFDNIDHHHHHFQDQLAALHPLPIRVPGRLDLFTMASIARSTLLRQSALAARSVSTRSAFAQPAFQSNVMKVAAFHSSSKRSAILPEGPRKDDLHMAVWAAWYRIMC